MSSSRPTSTDLTRADLRRSPSPCLLTGGQTGVDTLAALAGLRAGLPVHLVFPLGLRQEDGPLPAARSRALRGATIHELASPEFTYRTWTCVYLSDAVILIDPAGGDGCQETIRAADRLARPLLNLSAGAELLQPEQIASPLALPEAITAWLERLRPSVLMLAGCRSSVLGDLAPRVEAQLSALMPGIARKLSLQEERPSPH